MTEQPTEVAVVDEHQAPAPAAPAAPDVFTTSTAPTTPALQRMAAEAQALDTAYKMAVSLSKTNAVPQRYQQSFIPNNADEPQGIAAAYDLAAAIMYGAELGMSALQSAQNVFSVHGTPAVYSKTMVAQVRRWVDGRHAAGEAHPDDGVWEVSANKDKVVWAGSRDGRTAVSEWDIARAQAAGFTRNNLYTKMPIEMLRAKAQAEVCRILFQDVLLGMSHSVEELQLAEGIVVQRVAPAQRPAVAAKGVAGLQAMIEQRQPHPAEPGPADQSTEQAPLPEQQPVPQDTAPGAEAADPAPGSGHPMDDPEVREAVGVVVETEKRAREEDTPKARRERKRQIDEATAGQVNSQGEPYASRERRAELEEALTGERINGGRERLEYVGQIIGRPDLDNLNDLSEKDVEEVLSVLGAPAVKGGRK